MSLPRSFITWVVEILLAALLMEGSLMLIPLASFPDISAWTLHDLRDIAAFYLIFVMYLGLFGYGQLILVARTVCRGRWLRFYPFAAAGLFLIYMIVIDHLLMGERSALSHRLIVGGVGVGCATLAAYLATWIMKPAPSGDIRSSNVALEERS